MSKGCPAMSVGKIQMYAWPQQISQEDGQSTGQQTQPQAFLLLCVASAIKTTFQKERNKRQGWRLRQKEIINTLYPKHFDFGGW